MRCLVTGATGHIGNVLVKKLYDKGFLVHALVLDNDDTSAIYPYAEIIKGCVRDKAKLIEIVKNYDIVFHLAGIVEIRTGKKKQLYQTNVEGTRNLIEACQINKVKRLVYTSSVHAIEEKGNNQLIIEPSSFNPKKVKGNYAKSKAIATDLVLNQTDKNLETIIVYPSGVIGPCDYKLSNFGQVFTDYFRGRLKAYIDGGYNFVDVRDLSEGIIQAAIKGKDKEGYIMSGHSISVKELLDYMALYTNRKKVKMKLPYWFIKSMAYIVEFIFFIIRRRPLFTHYSISVLNSNHNFSNEKAKLELGFETRDIYESIRNTVDFAIDHHLDKCGNKYKKKLTN
ncbi:MAG: NAD-dependent epimerase/dehydratase family protein [Candidatus Izemoplasmatales bacterium]